MYFPLALQLITKIDSRFDNTGRLRGKCSVYMLLCEAPDAIYIKVGMAADPLKRVKELITGCPFKLGVLATVRLWTRRQARRLEHSLHTVLWPWHSDGEWFRFEIKDKEQFNLLTRTALEAHSSPSHKLRWTKINMDAFRGMRNSIERETVSA